MKLIGVTGGIASGKSTLMRMFRAAGVPGIDSDRIVHRLLRRGTRVFSKVKAVFGKSCLAPGGEIDRRKLGRKVFSDTRARRRLEAIVHPAVFSAIDQSSRRLARRGARIAAVDIPLLFETRSARKFDLVVVAYAPRSVQLRRLRERNLTRAEAIFRLRAQWSLEWKRRRADAVFDMTKPISKLKKEVGQWIRRIRTGKPASATRSNRS